MSSVEVGENGFPPAGAEAFRSCRRQVLAGSIVRFRRPRFAFSRKRTTQPKTSLVWAQNTVVGLLSARSAQKVQKQLEVESDQEL
jgi:hypothetical protein